MRQILNSKQVKHLHTQLGEQFGFTGKLDYAFLKSNKQKIYIITKDIAEISYEELKIDSLGIYFAEDKNGIFRLSIEGSQIIGPEATKNIVELDDEQFRQWFKGMDIEVTNDGEGFQLVKHGKDFYSCGYLKENNLRNFVPKTRRITTEL